MDNLEPIDASEAPNPAKSSYKKLALAIAALSLTVVIGLSVAVYAAFYFIRANVQSTSLAIPLLADEPVENEIAFIGNDFNLWLVSPTGADLRRLTLDGRGYRFPTWSPDGRQIAFIGRNETETSVLYVSPTNRSAPSVIFDQLGSSPFYLYWAPDSQDITFLTQEEEGLAMRLVDTQQPETNRILGEGAPFYWAWSPQSDKMLMHVGGSRATSDEAHISLLDNQEDAERVELKLAPGRFQAPVWSVDGSYIYYIAADDDGSEAIFRTDPETLAQKKIARLNNFAHMVLSPDGQQLAYLQIEPGISPPFGRAYLVDVDGQNKQRLMDKPVASMYWSPDGTKLALLSLSRPNEGPTAAKINGLAAPLSQELQLRWWLYDLETEELQPIISFEPTVNFLQTIPYFDQYHLSLTFWSPNSRYLVVTESVEEQNIAGKVWVVDTTGQEEPLKVGDGSLAVWSWR